MMLRYDFFLSLPIMNSNFLDIRLCSRVVHGRKLGRQLGFPTANLMPPDDYDMPSGLGSGVYLGRMCGELSGHWALVNVGYRSTLETSWSAKIKTLSIEVYILDFDDDLYGQKIEVRLIEKLREELHFQNAQLLVEQIRKDEQLAREKIEILNT